MILVVAGNEKSIHADRQPRSSQVTISGKFRRWLQAGKIPGSCALANPPQQSFLFNSGDDFFIAEGFDALFTFGQEFLLGAPDERFDFSFSRAKKFTRLLCRENRMENILTFKIPLVADVIDPTKNLAFMFA